MSQLLLVETVGGKLLQDTESGHTLGPRRPHIVPQTVFLTSRTATNQYGRKKEINILEHVNEDGISDDEFGKYWASQAKDLDAEGKEVLKEKVISLVKSKKLRSEMKKVLFPKAAAKKAELEKEEEEVVQPNTPVAPSVPTIPNR